MKGYDKQHFRDHGAAFETSADMEDNSKPLFAFQPKVERLPVPSLEHTKELFLRSVRPHVSSSEFAETTRKAEEFFKPGGLAQELQQRLINRKDSLPNTSWFIEWWNNWAYLGYRDSVVWNVSYYLQFADEFGEAMICPRRRAARFVSHLLVFREQVVNSTLSPDMNKGKAMSNTQYKYMFNTCRMPGKDLDFVRTYNPKLFTHFVVARKNRFYSFDVIDKSTGMAYSTDDIESQLNRIAKMADQRDNYGVGILTAADRDSWYRNRCQLVELGQNATSLEVIESSIGAICLDDTSPVTREEIGRSLLNSDGRNRFWDKSFQLIFFENGKGGYCGEHAMMDGTTSTRMVNYCLDQLFKDSPDIKRPGNNPTSLAEPICIQFALNSSLKNEISKAVRDFDDNMATKELRVCMFHGFGKEEIKKYKVSPDAFAQMAIQLAYRKTFGQCRGTYESTQTRSFLHGRTEVTRSVSNDSETFCDAMTQHTASPNQCYELLTSAAKSHSEYSSRAGKGLGCDRHLLGLKLSMKPGETAEIFDDVGYSRSGTWAISTSGLAGEYMDGWGFGEVVPHGIGVGYSVLNHRLRFTVTSRNKWADRMVANLESSLLEMQYVCEAQQEVRSRL